MDMQTQTAIRRLTKRANEFLGMTLDEYLIRFTYVYDGRWCMNENQSMQKCWYALGCPTSESEIGTLPMLTIRPDGYPTQPRWV
jgi:hypothetical protein